MKLGFLILSQPRSRTKWLSVYFSRFGFRCGHDLALGCSTVDEFVGRVSDFGGSVETSISLGCEVWREIFPQTKLVTVRRPVREIAKSIQSLDKDPDWLFLVLQDIALERFNSLPDIAGFTFNDLKSSVCRAALCEFVDFPWDADEDSIFAEQNIQVNFAERLAEVEVNRENTTKFLNDLAIRLSVLRER